MKKTPWIISCLSGCALSTTLILACSDDSPTDADAAVCDCPAAEAPLAGRIVRVRNTATIPANDNSTQSASCPEGATILGGGCTQIDVGGPFRSVQLYDSGPRPAPSLAYGCAFFNTDTIDHTIAAEVICLVPAQ